MKKKILILSIIFFALDQISKIILDKVLVLGKSYNIFAKFLYITKAYNDGVSFSMLQGHRFLIIVISLIVKMGFLKGKIIFYYLKKMSLMEEIFMI